MRRITTHRKVNYDGEELAIVTIYEPGIRKKDIRNENKFSKQHQFLAERRNRFKLVEEKA